MPHRITIPETHPHHQELTHIMNSFADKHTMLNVFLSYSQVSQKHIAVIHLSDAQIPDDVPESKWIRKVMLKCNTHIILLRSMDIKKHLKSGSLFISRHCHASSLIYKSEEHGFPYPELFQQLRKFRRLKQEYYRAHDVLRTRIRKAEHNNSPAMAYHLYTSLFEHHLFHLELLHLGHCFCNEMLDERLLRLENFIPEIKSLMLKKTATTYFITDALLSAEKLNKEEAENIRLKTEFKEAIAGTEQQLHHLVERTFREIKKAVKNPEVTKALIQNKAVSPYQFVIKILTGYFNIEEIFLFHREEVSSGNQKATVLYLLLISDKISNQDLYRMMKMVTRQTERKYNIVPLAHSKTWIQEHLWESQEFFLKIMVPENVIYTAGFPSVIHWHTKEPHLYTDEDLYQSRCTALYEKYKVCRSREKSFVHEGMGLIISGIFYRACAVFIYARIHYRPNEINIRILWKLCEYAEPKVKNLDYLIQKLPFDFLKFLTPSKNLYKNTFYLDEEILCVFDELIKGFLSLSEDQFEK